MERLVCAKDWLERFAEAPDVLIGTRDASGLSLPGTRSFYRRRRIRYDGRSVLR